MLAMVPWWIWMIIIFICFSGYMAFRAMRAERRLENYYIEREGNVYMQRIEEERQLRHRQH